MSTSEESNKVDDVNESIGAQESAEETVIITAMSEVAVDDESTTELSTGTAPFSPRAPETVTAPPAEGSSDAESLTPPPPASVSEATSHAPSAGSSFGAPAAAWTLAPLAPLPSPRTRWAGIIWGALFVAVAVFALWTVIDVSARAAVADWWFALTTVSSLAYVALALGAVSVVCAVVGLIGRAQRQRETRRLSAEPRATNAAG